MGDAAITATALDRPLLLHQRAAVQCHALPRYTASQLASQLIEPDGDLDEPFVLTDNMTFGWSMPLTHKQNVQWLDEISALWPDGIAEFAPNNLLGTTHNGSPRRVLAPLPTAMSEIMQWHKGHRTAFKRDPSVPAGAYALFQMPSSRWALFERRGDVPKPDHLPPRGAAAASSLVSCLGEAMAAEWELKSHWAMLLVGTRGAGMLNHTDSLGVGSWHAHLTGRKWWYLSAAPMALRHRAESGRRCWEGVVEAGEVLYYGRNWWHETQCIDTPTVTLSQSLIQRPHVRALVEQVVRDCALSERTSPNLRMSGALCDAWDRCGPQLLARFATEPAKQPPLPSWRQIVMRESAARATAMGRRNSGKMAARRAIRKREEVLPLHYIYEALNLSLNRNHFEAHGMEIDLGEPRQHDVSPAARRVPEELHACEL